MRVQVAYAGPEFAEVVTVDLEPGATVTDAVARSGMLSRIAAPASTLGWAIFGRRSAADVPVSEGDRVEITRALECDPKLARRARAKGKPPVARTGGTSRGPDR
jgi:putative ubiquitin-RnfH superfamily antitoxin RatB of RatAB toxin-antitoxin module